MELKRFSARNVSTLKCFVIWLTQITVPNLLQLKSPKNELTHRKVDLLPLLDLGDEEVVLEIVAANKEVRRAIVLRNFHPREAVVRWPEERKLLISVGKHFKMYGCLSAVHLLDDGDHAPVKYKVMSRAKLLPHNRVNRKAPVPTLRSPTIDHWEIMNEFWVQ